MLGSLDPQSLNTLLCMIFKLFKCNSVCRGAKGGGEELTIDLKCTLELEGFSNEKTEDLQGLGYSQGTKKAGIAHVLQRKRSTRVPKEVFGAKNPRTEAFNLQNIVGSLNSYIS